MPRSYEQLSRVEREYIALRRRQGAVPARIAGELGRHRSTIYRELSRNRDGRGSYYSTHAHCLALTRRHKVRKPKKLQYAPLRRSVERALQLYWSPEQIEGRRRSKGMMSISRMTVYRHIHEDPESFAGCLRGTGRSGARRERIHHRVMIDERPVVVNQRERFGDWESDTVRGSKRSPACIATHVERRSYYLVACRLERCNGEQMNRQTVRAMAGLPMHTLTVDNGMEFGSFKQLEEQLGAQVYFAHEKKPWERARNEHTNRLLRQFFPKRTDFSTVSPEEVLRAQTQLNNRPRKALNYKTPKEVMHQALVALAI